MNISDWMLLLYFCSWVVYASLKWLWQREKYNLMQSRINETLNKLDITESKLERMENAIEEIEDQTQCELVVTRKVK